MKAYFTPATAAHSFKAGSAARIKTKNAKRNPGPRLSILTLAGIMIIAAAVLAVPSYSVHSNSLAKPGSDGNSNSTILSRWPPNLGLTALFPQASPDPIATFASDCLTPKTTFVLGETVCAKATGVSGLRFAWVDSAGFIRQRTNITTDPQTDTFTLPTTQTSIINDTTVDNRGEWRVNIITSRGSTKASAFFTVKDPQNPAVDLSITKSLLGDNPQENGSVQFEVIVMNNGPDDAANTRFQDYIFSGATYNSVTQTEGLPFICSGSGSADCSITLFPKGSKAKFLVNFTAGPAGGDLQNTASVSSDTTEQNSLDNTFTTGSVKVGSGAAPPTCVLECPQNINANADTEENGQRGAHVNYDPPQTSGTCGEVTSSPASGSFFPVGTTTVTATSTEGNGSCSFTVTVTDTGSNVTISCPSNKTADADSNCQAFVDAGTPTTTGDNVTVSSSRSDGLPLSDPYGPGVTTVTWTATSHDSPGGTETGNASCTQTVTVSDTTPPTITCPADITTGTDPGSCFATVNPGTPTITDNCEPTVTGVRSDGEPLEAPYPKGTTTITWTASDSAGSASCNQTVTVNDTESPVISCPADITTNSAPGECSASVDPGTATATDNCGTATISGSRSDGAPLTALYPTGTTTITWTASDGTNSSSCTQTVTVSDNEAPAITCPANITQANDPGTCSANINPGTATATDNCGTPTVTGTRSDGQALTAPYPQGTTTITWTATDGSGQTASCTQTVTVNDTENPVITCPADITTGTDAGSCSATVNPGPATATDNCGNPTVTGTRSDGKPLTDPYPQGTTIITWTATDGSGRSSSCTQTVTVNDTENPVISCPADITVSSPLGSCSTSLSPGTATATDNCGSPTVTASRSDGQPLTAPYPNGTLTITWTATDGSGNSSSCDQTITVNDTQAPAITCPADITTSTDPGQCSANVDPGTATATDNCGEPTVTGTRSDGLPLTAPYPKGTTTITWTAIDSSGNSSSCTQTVTVNDTESPAISCPANIMQPTDPGTCAATVNPGTATATDNCGTATVTGTRSDGQPLNASYPRGTTTITWTATDGSGNQSSCTQTITVTDNEAPTITTNGQTPTMWPANHKYKTFQLTEFVTGASDNCDTVGVSNVVIAQVTSDETENGDGDGNTFNDIVIAADCKSVQLRAERNSGGDGRVYTITFRVTDSSGNVGTKTSQVHVPRNLGVPVVDSGPHYTVTGTCP